ncbi:ATP-binding protein [Flagellatimonas centrodinii]|uniref:ATP-binding protein n=1 Tax=Flagellatimonas centrodinii TaxID=2806210 RepID=UPI001FFD929B|nr:ATP-binding protein [Flagellatimonas centrodinii]ULQ45256.1 ATP-binding protein [Flagellatimonas centrodinii]
MNQPQPRTLLPHLLACAGQYPIVTVTGPRQSGKTTLCRMAFPDKPYVSLEPLDTREFARDDPRGFLAQYPDGAILDEAQRVPALFSYLQDAVDRDPRKGRFIVSGSENLALSQAISQSLAGRTAMRVLLPFSLEEQMRLPGGGPATLDDTLWAGGYPRPRVEGIPPDRWLGDYYTTYIQRDVRQLSQIGDLDSFSRFVRLCAGRTGQEVNLSQLGGDAGVSHNTARAWLGVLQASYLVFTTPAWFRNVTKQLIKAPKLHFCDSGLACALLGIRSADQLQTHPLRGALFESWVASEVHKWHLHRGLPSMLHHYRETRGTEIDILIPQGAAGIAVECKSGQTVQPAFLRGLKTFGDETWKRRLIYGGDSAQQRSDCEVLPWHALATCEWG